MQKFCVFQCPLNRFDWTWWCRNPLGNLRFLFFFGLRNHDSKSMTCLVSRQVQSGDTCLWRTALMTHCGCVTTNHSVAITRGRMSYKRSLFSLKMSCHEFSWSNDCWRRASLRIRSISVESPVSIHPEVDKEEKLSTSLLTVAAKELSSIFFYQNMMSFLH